MHLCADMMRTICSPARVEAVLSSALAVMSDHTAMQKVMSWAKATAAALDRLKEDFTAFPDIVEPFSMALSQVLQPTLLDIHNYVASLQSHTQMGWWKQCLNPFVQYLWLRGEASKQNCECNAKLWLMPTVLLTV